MNVQIVRLSRKDFWPCPYYANRLLGHYLNMMRTKNSRIAFTVRAKSLSAPNCSYATELSCNEDWMVFQVILRGFQGYLKEVCKFSMVFQECFKVVSRKFPISFKSDSRKKFWGCFKEDWREFSVGFMSILKKVKENVRGVSKVFHGRSKEVSRMFQERF